MSSINSISSAIYVPPSGQTQGTQGVQGASDPDDDGDGGQRVQGSDHHGHGKGRGAGPMQDAIMQALQSLGLNTTPAPATSNTTTAASGTTTQGSGTDSDGDDDGSTSAAGNVKSDIRQFMHALFQAVKGQNTSSAASTASTGSDPKSNFAAGLASLISQVSSGTAPAELQSAFSKVVTDLQGSSVPTTTGTDSAGSSQVTLQALLSKLQQNLGYGAVSSNAAVGNFVNEHG